MEFQPCYVWPSTQFPFRHYYKHSKLDIFIIENVVHNYGWLKKYRERITQRHFFFVYSGWYLDAYQLKQSEEMFSLLNLHKGNFFFLFNSLREKELFEQNGFSGALINHNCWLDENIIKPKYDTVKNYNAVLMARPSVFKRHYLAKKVPNLALIMGFGKSYSKPLNYEIPPHNYCSNNNLNSTEVCEILSKSSCGLALSVSEGACFSSSEYLLSGIPVVSTKSNGGRDFWYSSYNSIICEDSPESVAEAVRFFIENPRDGEKIRADHIVLARQQREVFIRVLQAVFERYGIQEDARSYFQKHFFHKMISVDTPQFDRIL